MAQLQGKMGRPAASRSAGVAVALLLGLGLAGPAQAVQYSLTDIGLLTGYAASRALGVSDAGQVAGVDFPASGTSPSRAFVWSAGAGLQMLAPLSGANDSYGVAINTNGIAVGSSTWSKAVLWAAGSSVATQLPDLGGTNSYARDINGANAIAGYAKVPSGSYQATLWSPSGGGGYSVTSLGLVSGLNQSYGLGINASGQVVGYGATNQPTDARAFVWTDGAGISALPLLSGGSVSEGYGINDSGATTGWSGSTAGDRAVLWGNAASGYAPTDLGVLAGDASSRAWALNNAGVVVGRSTGTGGDRAFVWADATAGMVDLNTVLTNGTGWTVNTAYDVNNLGWIVGWATYNGTTHAVLLTPVPAPGGGLLFAAGLLLLGAVRRRLA